MAKNIEPNLKKIGTYLKLDNDTIFTIPEYQRAYSWDIARCDKLWQDVIDFSESDNKDAYFFGTIIINCIEDDTKLVLIDGQQRTTSFLLLLKALLIGINDAIIKIPDDPDSERLLRGLKGCRKKIMMILYKAEEEDISDCPTPDMDRALYNAEILDNQSINENDKYKNELKTILNSYSYAEAESSVLKIKYKQKDNRYTNFFRNFKFFYEKAKELSSSQLNKFTKCILENCEVIVIKSWKVEQAITMFNSLNSDGMPLFDSDIISAKFFAKAISQGQDEIFKGLWRALLDTIEASNNEVINIDSILMQHMYYIRAYRHEVISETGKPNVTTPGVRRYFLGGENGDGKDAIINHPVEACRRMLELAKIWNAAADYPVLKVLLKFNENAKLFLGSYFYRFNGNIPSSDEITSISETLLRLFTVLDLVDVGYSSSKFKSFLFAESVKLVDPFIPFEEIISDFSKHIIDNWHREDIKKAIIDSENNSLVYLNEYLLAKNNGTEFKFSEKYDIEHIMPSSGSNLQVIREDAGIVDETEFKDMVNKLGNKILLEVKINRSIGNEWFRTKIHTALKDKTGYIDSIYPMANELVNKFKNIEKPYWKKEDILSSTEDASERISKFIFGNK